MKKILVIDDDESVRDAFELALEDSDYEVDTAEDGEQGLARATEYRPDLVFLDLRMPGIDGVETLRRLHSLHEGIRVYIVTAFHKEFTEPLNAVAAAGIEFEVVNKPISSQQIQQLASAVLGSPLAC